MKPSKPDFQPRPIRSGFTLVELMVVIVIVAVLTAIGMVVGGKVRASAQEAACMSNLRQIGQLMNGAAAENHGIFPTGGNPRGYIRNTCAAMFSDYPNTGGPKDAPFFDKGPGNIFICPAHKNGHENLGKSYLANGKIVGVSTADGSWLNQWYAPKRIPAIRHPERTFLVIEDWRRDGTKLWRGNDIRYRPTSADDNFDAHRGGRHYLYVDGHVEMLVEDPGLDDDGFAIHYEGE